MSLIQIDMNAKRVKCLRDVDSDDHSIGGITEGSRSVQYSPLEIPESKSSYSEISYHSECMDADDNAASGRPGGDLSLHPSSKKKKLDGPSQSDREDPLRCKPSTNPDWPWS